MRTILFKKLALTFSKQPCTGQIKLACGLDQTPEPPICSSAASWQLNGQRHYARRLSLAVFRSIGGCLTVHSQGNSRHVQRARPLNHVALGAAGSSRYPSTCLGLAWLLGLGTPPHTLFVNVPSCRSALFGCLPFGKQMAGGYSCTFCLSNGAHWVDRVCTVAGSKEMQTNNLNSEGTDSTTYLRLLTYHKSDLFLNNLNSFP